MNSTNDIIKFYKDCYLYDYKAISVNNFFNKNIELQYFLNSFEPFNGKLLDYPVNSDWGKTIDEELSLNSKEKGLYAGTFFLKGKINILGKETKVITPLYLFEVNLNQIDDIYSIELNLNNPIINPTFLDLIKNKYDFLNLSYDDFSSHIPKGILDFDNLFLLKKNLRKLFPNLNIESIDKWMSLNFDENNLKSIYKSNSKKYDNYLIASSAIGLIKKPKGSRGVINELNTITDSKTKNFLVESIFNSSKRNIQTKHKKNKPIRTPVSLSESQKQVFNSLNKHNLTLVIGPPGTGKSFTIAALTADLISKGKSVLIASKNNQAGKVVSNKIEYNLGLKGLVVKTARYSYKRSLKTRLNNILNGIAIKRVHVVELRRLEKDLNDINSEIDGLIRYLKKREEDELKWGTFFDNYDNRFFSRIKKKWIEYQHRNSTSIFKIKSDIDNLEIKRIRKTKKSIKDRYNLNLYNNTLNKRKQVKFLVKALEEKAGNLINEQFDKIDFNLLFKALPAWICNTSDIHNILPLRKDLFDVVIIDEATQCDISSTIPILYRAKKAIIVGDPKQLKHISFLSSSHEKTLKEKYNLDSQILNYRNNSILDLINDSIQSQEQVIFLNEHYRSSPDIIDFSNRKFYSENLSIMTESPVSNVKRNIFLKEVNGKRSENGVNIEEANSIIQNISEIIKNEEKIEKHLCQSIGIISPFRPQVNYLKSLIRKTIDLNDFKRHNILIGTPFHFQGEERDVILLSFVVDDYVHPSTFLYLNREDVFNVSITRARNKQIVFTSLSYKNLNENYLISQYLNSISKTINIKLPKHDIHDKFADEVIDFINQKIRVEEIYKSFMVAGVEIDIVIVKNNKTYCLDLVGYPGIYERQFSPKKIKMLNRMNHPIFFITFSSWFLKQRLCKKEIIKFIDNN